MIALIPNFKARKQQKLLAQAAQRIFNDVHQHVRAKWFYLEASVPDTAAARFELITLYLTIITLRLSKESEAPQAKELMRLLAEQFFDQLDIMFREMGVGDMGVGKKVRALADQYFERGTRLAELYGISSTREELDAKLNGYILDSIYGGKARNPSGPALIQADLADFETALAKQTLEDIIAKSVEFPNHGGPSR